MKLCSKCGEVKSSDSFNKRIKAEDGLQGRCKTCMNKINRDMRGHRTAVIGRWKVIKGCQNIDCKGYPKHRAALHLAHKIPALKHYKHSGAYKAWWSWKRIKEELAKCTILCANCHAVETYDEEHYLLGNKRDNLYYKK